MVFVGGKLSLKGDKKKKGKKKKSKSKHDKKKSSRDEEAAAAAAAAAADDDDDEDEMTEAERKAQKYKQNAEKKDLEKVAKQSHRDRVEEFSQKLSELTELNDIPRVRSLRYIFLHCVRVFAYAHATVYYCSQGRTGLSSYDIYRIACYLVLGCISLFSYRSTLTLIFPFLLLRFSANPQVSAAGNG